MSERRHIQALAAMVGAVLCWSTVPVFLKHFTASYDAWTVNGMRYGVAALVLLPFLPVTSGNRQPGRNIWKDALVPAVVNVLGQVGWAIAPYHNDASVMGFTIRSSFFFTLLTGLWLVPEERYLVKRRSFWVGSLVCVLGVIALFSAALRHGGTSPTGMLILLGTAMVWGFYGVTVRRYMATYSTHHSFAVICLYTAVVLLVLMVCLGDVRAVAAAGSGPLFLLIASAVLGIASAHVLMYYAVIHIGPILQSGSEFVTPFLTFAGAAILLGETVTPFQWIGGIGVTCGSLIMLTAHRRAPEIGARLRAAIMSRGLPR